MSYRYGDRAEEKSTEELLRLHRTLFPSPRAHQVVSELQRRSGAWINWAQAAPPPHLPVDVQYKDGRIYPRPQGFPVLEDIWQAPEEWAWRPMRLSGIEKEEIYQRTGKWPV